MGWPARSQPSRARRVFASFALFVVSIGFYQFSVFYTTSLGDPLGQFIPSSISATEHIHTPEVQEYWRILRDELSGLTPSAKRIQTQPGIVDGDEHEPEYEDDEDVPDQDVIGLDDDDFRAVRKSHDGMLQLLPTLGENLPFRDDTRGIVMTTESKHIGMVMFSIRMLRRTGSQLPVVVFLHTYADYSSYVCEELLPDLHAECVVFSDLLDTSPPSEPLGPSQLKVFAVLFAPFQEVLFLSADAIPANSPDELFQVELYKSTGLVTWPDDRETVTSSLFYNIARTRSPHLDERTGPGFEVLLYDKSSHAEDLLLALFYNFFGPGWFYPLLSQEAPERGERKTFLLAAMALGTPYYDVKSPMISMERRISADRRTSATEREEEASQDRAFHWARQVPSALSDIRVWIGETVLGQKVMEIAGSGKTQDKPKEGSREARPFFFRNGKFKTDIESLLELGATAEHRNQRGYTQRFRRPGSGPVVNDSHDIERALWEELGTIATQMLARKGGRRR